MTARREEGFTLIELIVAMTITTIVFAATLAVMDAFQRNNRADLLRSETQDNARNALDRLARDLRNAVAPATNAFGTLEQASAYSVAFQITDTSRVAGGANASNAMRVRYCLDNSNPENEVLWRQEKRWTTAEAPTLPAATACPDLAGSDWDSSTRLVGNLTNRIGGQSRSLFVYGPAGATLVSQITAVQASLFIDLHPGQRPGESQLTSGVLLRSANRQPIVAFTAKEVNGHVLLNASESRDPNGLSLTYKWWDGATELPTTAQQYETGLLVSKSSHTFKLEVTNPGGLSNSTSQTVVIK